MSQPPTELLSRACRTFLSLAYPGGEATIPAAKRVYAHIAPDQGLELLLAPPVCQPVCGPDGNARGYAFRLGSATYPHLKVQVINCDRSATWVFAVDTHDTLRLEPNHPDAPGWARLQAANARLKERVERAWEADGLLTFNALLRRDLG
jgi:hypothetical protein